jgi:hypothetical protein
MGCTLAGSQESFSGYCRLAAQAMLQTAMEIEATDFIGRTGYQRREEDQGIYRNVYKRRRVATGEGAIELHVPQTRDGVEPFQTKIIEAYRRRSDGADGGLETHKPCPEPRRDRAHRLGGGGGGANAAGVSGLLRLRRAAGQPAVTAIAALKDMLTVAFARGHVEKWSERGKQEAGFGAVEVRTDRGLIRHWVCSRRVMYFLAPQTQRFRGEKSVDHPGAGGRGGQHVGVEDREPLAALVG